MAYSRRVFADLTGKVGGSLKATAKHPGVVTKALIKNPELDEVLSAAEEILDFKTKAARDIEAARIKASSIRAWRITFDARL